MAFALLEWIIRTVLRLPLAAYRMSALHSFLSSSYSLRLPPLAALCRWAVCIASVLVSGHITVQRNSSFDLWYCRSGLCSRSLKCFPSFRTRTFHGCYFSRWHSSIATHSATWRLRFGVSLFTRFRLRVYILPLTLLRPHVALIRTSLKKPSWVKAIRAFLIGVSCSNCSELTLPSIRKTN